MTLHEIRKHSGLNKTEAGAKLGITCARFGQLEKAWPSVALDTVIRICRAFKVRHTIDENGNVSFAFPENT